jgi:hypothetical protein
MNRSVWALLVAVLFLPILAHADSTSTLPAYSGSEYLDPGPYQPPTVIGTFDILAGDTAITISGTFGNDAAPNSAGVDVYLGSILVGQCVEDATCWSAGSPTAWSDTLTAAQIASLGTGIVNFTAIQTSEFVIQLGETTLVQTNSTPAVPEPSSLVLFGSGALALIGAVRRKLVG